MKQRLFFIILFLFPIFYSSAQSCFPEGIIFDSQDEVDQFSVNNPGCYVIQGNVIIGDDIQNVNGLSGLSVIRGSLLIYANILTDLSGLNNLDSIGGDFHLVSCDALTILDSFNDLLYIGGDFDIHWNYNLTTISGFANLSFDSTDAVYIYENIDLHACNSPALCSFIGNPSCPVTIYMNDLDSTGLNRPAELAQTCGLPVVCLPYGNNIFFYQTQIDSFPVLYPGCTTLNGKTCIGGSTVNNLNGLSQINQIDGDLTISMSQDNTSPVITNLQGLNNLDSITGSLNILNLGSLTSLAGLDSLKYLGGDLILNSISSLSDISALGNLTNVRNLEIVQVHELTNLYGLHNIQKISGSLLLVINNKLIDLSSFTNIDTIMGNLEIAGIWNTGIEEFSNLKYLGGLNLRQNPFLRSLKGLENVSGGEMDLISIYYNDSLSECAVQSICDYLADPDAYTYIYWNNTGCNDVEEVRSACATINTDDLLISRDITIFPNPNDGSFQVNGISGKDAMIEIFNLTGQIMATSTVSNNSVIYASRLASGFYIAVITDDNQISSIKFAIK